MKSVAFWTVFLFYMYAVFHWYIWMRRYWHARRNGLGDDAWRQKLRREKNQWHITSGVSLAVLLYLWLW